MKSIFKQVKPFLSTNKRDALKKLARQYVRDLQYVRESKWLGTMAVISKNLCFLNCRDRIHRCLSDKTIEKTCFGILSKSYMICGNEEVEKMEDGIFFELVQYDKKPAIKMPPETRKIIVPRKFCVECREKNNGTISNVYFFEFFYSWSWELF